MRKIFYKPDTLEIRAMSDGDNPVDLPFIEVEKDYETFQFLKLEKKGKKIEVFDNEPKRDREKIEAEKSLNKEYKLMRKTEHREKILAKEEKRKGGKK